MKNTRYYVSMIIVIFSYITIYTMDLDDDSMPDYHSPQGELWLLCSYGKSIEDQKEALTIINSNTVNVHWTSVWNLHYTFLHSVATNPLFNLRIATCLLDKGIDVNACTSLGWTALHNTCLQNSKSHVLGAKLLLDRGATINCTDGHGKTPLHFATSEPIANACPELVDLLIKHGASVHFISKTGYAPLSWLCRLNTKASLPIAKLLLKAGASVNGLPDEQGTPLECILNHSLDTPPSIPLIQLLFGWGANPHVKSKNSIKSPFERNPVIQNAWETFCEKQKSLMHACEALINKTLPLEVAYYICCLSYRKMLKKECAWKTKNSK